jgi:hypothetical protein
MAQSRPSPVSDGFKGIASRTNVPLESDGVATDIGPAGSQARDMRRSFGSLPFLGRLSIRAERSPGSEAAPVRAPIDPDLAPVGPPVLLPSTIVRQVLIDATQLVPAWAMPRAEAGQATTPTEPKATKRPRRPRATETSAAKPRTSKPAIAKPAPAKPRSRTRKRDA